MYFRMVNVSWKRRPKKCYFCKIVVHIFVIKTSKAGLKAVGVALEGSNANHSGSLVCVSAVQKFQKTAHFYYVGAPV